MTTHAIEVGGRERTYHLHLPPHHSKATPAPLVVALHGRGGTGEGFDQSTNGQVVREADRRGYIVVFPEGIDKGWNDGRPPVSDRDRDRSGVDDVAFVSALVDRIDTDHGVDRSRVYAMGISNGGFMSLRLAIDLSDRFAAVAAVAASVTKVMEPLVPKRPVAVVFVNGTADPLVPFGGGQVRVLGRDRGEVLSTDDSVRWWVGHDRCAVSPSARALPDTATDDGATVRVEAHEGCADGSAVVLYRVEGGGHTWPGGAQYLPKAVVGTVCRDIDATSEIFDFFAKHRR